MSINIFDTVNYFISYFTQLTIHKFGVLLFIFGVFFFSFFSHLIKLQKKVSQLSNLFLCLNHFSNSLIPTCFFSLIQQTIRFFINIPCIISNIFNNSNAYRNCNFIKTIIINMFYI